MDFLFQLKVGCEKATSFSGWVFFLVLEYISEERANERGVSSAPFRNRVKYQTWSSKDLGRYFPVHMYPWNHCVIQIGQHSSYPP